MYLVYVPNYNVLFFTKRFEVLGVEILFKHKGTYNKAQYDIPLAWSWFFITWEYLFFHNKNR